MSNSEPGRAIFWGVSVGGAAATRVTVAGAAASAAGAAAVAGWAWPDTMAKNAFWAASRAASPLALGAGWAVGGRGLGRIGVTGPAVWLTSEAPNLRQAPQRRVNAPAAPGFRRRLR